MPDTPTIAVDMLDTPTRLQQSIAAIRADHGRVAIRCNRPISWAWEAREQAMNIQHWIHGQGLTAVVEANGIRYDPKTMMRLVNQQDPQVLIIPTLADPPTIKPWTGGDWLNGAVGLLIAWCCAAFLAIPAVWIVQNVWADIPWHALPYVSIWIAISIGMAIAFCGAMASSDDRATEQSASNSTTGWIGGFLGIIPWTALVIMVGRQVGWTSGWMATAIIPGLLWLNHMHQFVTVRQKIRLCRVWFGQTDQVQPVRDLMQRMASHPAAPDAAEPPAQVRRMDPPGDPPPSSAVKRDMS